MSRRLLHNDVPEPWQGETYYGRQQVKSSPFDPSVVGGYVFLAGLSGSACVLAALTKPRASADNDDVWEPMRRRARYLSLLAPTVGAALLVYDLHTPSRFYNMLRVAKHTSPMSIGSWLLMGFSSAAGLGGIAQIARDLWPYQRWPLRLLELICLPSAVTGAGLSTYTAGLLSATSTPLWSAAPRATALRFASTSVASAGAALALPETSPAVRRALEKVTLSALAVEIIGTLAAHATYETKGLHRLLEGRWGRAEKYAEAAGLVLPFALLAASHATKRRKLTTPALYATLMGSALFRMSFIGAGNEGAKQPRLSLRLAQRDNL
jgi:formate-dependent nitrite reductase membrane component NrfD